MLTLKLPQKQVKLKEPKDLENSFEKNDKKNIGREVKLKRSNGP